MELKMSPKNVVVVVGFDEPLLHLSCATEQTICWFTGSGVWRWNLNRTRIAEGVRVEFNALVEPNKPSFASTTAIGHLVQCKFIPEAIPESEMWKKNGGREVSVPTGPQRIKAFSKNQRGDTCLTSRETRPEMSMGEYAWGMADTFVSAFVEGAMRGKHQISLAVVQTWFDFGFDDSGMNEFLRKDYDADLKVSSLRW